MVPQVQPLEQSNLALYLADNKLHHPVHLLTALRAHTTAKQSTNTIKWLRMACQQKDKSATISALTLGPALAHPQGLDGPLSHTIINDLTEHGEDSTHQAGTASAYNELIRLFTNANILTQVTTQTAEGTRTNNTIQHSTIDLDDIESPDASPPGTTRPPVNFAITYTAPQATTAATHTTPIVPGQNTPHTTAMPPHNGALPHTTHTTTATPVQQGPPTTPLPTHQALHP